jgi:hypothetical protein
MTITPAQFSSAGRRLVVVGLTFVIGFAMSLRSTAHAQATPRLSGEDYAEILQLYFKYPVMLDSGDGEGYADLFTDDGSFGNRVGRAALIDFAKNRAPSTVRHAPLTPMIVATPEGARGVVLNLFVDAAQSPAVITRVTQYTDTLVKTARGWRFKTRVNGSADLTGGASGVTSAPAAPGAGRGVPPAGGGDALARGTRPGN